MQIKEGLDQGTHDEVKMVRNYFDGFVLPGTNDLESCRNSGSVSSFSKNRSNHSKRAWEYTPIKFSSHLNSLIRVE